MSEFRNIWHGTKNDHPLLANLNFASSLQMQRHMPAMVILLVPADLIAAHYPSITRTEEVLVAEIPALNVTL